MKILGGTSNGTWLSGLLVATLGLLGACAHSGPPPRELIEARAAFARASAGPARQYSPARLQLAKQALESAELAYGGAPPEEVSDRAYIAIRRVEAAEAEARAIAASQRRMKALRELATLQGVHADRARAEIAAAEQRADSEGQRASAAEQMAREEQGRAAQASASLETERAARAEAEAQARAALAELERQAKVKRESRGLVITLSGQVLFVTNEATLLPSAQRSLDSVAAAMKGVTAETGKVVIEGHTDSTGPRDYNMTLARRRAEAVQDYLVSRGVSRELFRVEGVGPDRPVASNRSPEGRANNRRVEIVIPAGAKLASERPLGSASRNAPASGTMGTPAGASSTGSGATGTATTSTANPTTGAAPSGTGTTRTPTGGTSTATGTPGGATSTPGATTGTTGATTGTTGATTGTTGATTGTTGATTGTTGATTGTTGATTGTGTTTGNVRTPGAPGSGRPATTSPTGTSPPSGPRPSSTSFPSTIEPPPGAVTPVSPGSTTPPAPGTSTSVPAPGSTSAPGPGSITPPPVPGSSPLPSPGSTTRNGTPPVTPVNPPSPGTSTPPSTPR